jgi:hypothetical protein
VNWAIDSGVLSTDEALLRPDPYVNVPEWCEERCRCTARWLARASVRYPRVDQPLSIAQEVGADSRNSSVFDLVRNERTADWHTRFNAKVVVSGHLHTRRTDWLDGSALKRSRPATRNNGDRAAGSSATCEKSFQAHPTQVE